MTRKNNLFVNYLTSSAVVGTVAAAGGLGIITLPAHAINITTETDATTLTNLLLANDNTINVIGTPIYFGGSEASGSFTDGSVIGLEEGILFTSGRATDAVGPNIADDTTFDSGTGGDADLDALIPQSTNNATFLQFDFTTTTGQIAFDYVFASEEYNEYVNSEFNDVFAFFLDGTNIALVPGTNTPVSINNVNNGNPLGTDATNPQFYNNNDLDDGGPFFDIEYDGFTDVFTAQASGLTIGQTYTIKLAVADAVDTSYDSAVFLGAGSFTGNPDPDPEKTPEPGSVLGLLGIGLLMRRISRPVK